MTRDRKKPGVAFWATVAVVVVLVGYPLSIGPWIAFYISTHMHQNKIVVPCAAYAPITMAGENGPDPVRKAYHSYITWWMDLGATTR